MSILPKFAAIVCNTTVSGICFSLPAVDSTSIANGTNVMSATSFVIIMLEKKHRKISTAEVCLVLLVRFKRLAARYENSPDS